MFIIDDIDQEIDGTTNFTFDLTTGRYFDVYLPKNGLNGKSEPKALTLFTGHREGSERLMLRIVRESDSNGSSDASAKNVQALTKDAENQLKLAEKSFTHVPEHITCGYVNSNNVAYYFSMIKDGGVDLDRLEKGFARLDMKKRPYAYIKMYKALFDLAEQTQAEHCNIILDNVAINEKVDIKLRGMESFYDDPSTKRCDNISLTNSYSSKDGKERYKTDVLSMALLILDLGDGRSGEVAKILNSSSDDQKAQKDDRISEQTERKTAKFS